MQGTIELPKTTHCSLDLARVLYSGQDFRWKERGNGWHSGVLDGNIVHLRQTPDTLEYRAHTNLDSLLISYFRLDEDMDSLFAAVSSLDSHIAALAQAYPYFRLLRQPDPWECTVAYICSANNSVERIGQIVEGIAEGLGQKLRSQETCDIPFPPPSTSFKQVWNRYGTCAWVLTATTRSLKWPAEFVRASLISMA